MGEKGEKTELGVTAFTENDRQNKPLPVKQLANASDAMDSQTTERIALHFIRHTSYQLKPSPTGWYTHLTLLDTRLTLSGTRLTPSVTLLTPSDTRLIVSKATFTVSDLACRIQAVPIGQKSDSVGYTLCRMGYRRSGFPQISSDGKQGLYKDLLGSHKADIYIYIYITLSFISLLSIFAAKSSLRCYNCRSR